MDTGGTYSFTFQNAGTFEYVCSIHPMMHGTVVVTK
jgi:plastocyanin